MSTVQPTETPSVPAPPILGAANGAAERRRAAVAGVLAAGAALAVGEAVTSLHRNRPSLVAAVGNRFIDSFAASLKEIAVQLFGTNDKAALIIGIVIISLGIGAALGVYSRRHRWAVPIGLALFGGVGMWAYYTDARGGGPLGVLGAVAGVGAGWLVYRGLIGAAPASVPAEASPAEAAPATPPIHVPGRQAADRRAFLVRSAGVGAGAAALAVFAQSRRRSSEAARARKTTVIPRATTVVPVPAGFEAAVPGLSPYVTPNDVFYRIDTALFTPNVNPDSWQLSIIGMVDEPFSLTYDELVEMSTVSMPVTLQCVSYEIGGDLVGNAVWQGVPLADLLARAGIQPGATQIVGRSVDGWTAGFPTELALDGRTALVAVAMNGEPLPQDHGFPARLVVSGLYGYVSATKWLDRIELTTWEDFDGYWIPRGWSKEGPIKTMSRIDVPRRNAAVTVGRQAIAGVAWAPNTGIAEVEVRIDDGDWSACTLGDAASDDTWVQWRYDWDATPGPHEIQVRATDRTGATQTEASAPPAPNGATGWHRVRVMVPTS